MRRSSFRKNSGTTSAGSESGFWPSYADMMSAVALILFFLMLLAYIQNLITGNNLKDTQALLNSVEVKLSDTELELANMTTELDDTRATLTLTLSEVDEAQEALKKLTIDLADTELTLSKSREETAALDAALAEKNATLLQQNSDLERQAALIAEQEQYVQFANEELNAMRQQMQTIAVLRLSTLEKIKDSLVNVMGDTSKVSVGKNGTLVLSSSVLFDLASSEIKPEAEPMLRQLITAFGEFLNNPENTEYVDSIVIAGHTDSIGFDEENRVLSCDRANAVMNFLLSEENGNLLKYSKYFMSAGYGESRPVADNETEAGQAANRRIEISIILKDETVMNILDTYLATEVPG